MRFGVVVFPGSNCDHDAWYALSHNLGQQAEFIFHDAPSIGDVDAVILPGGFAYGDYLRCGADSRFWSKPACSPARCCAIAISNSCAAP
jgi:phosphoribosylformylglycinamidine (FGAM) synthase-like amidotransferase family enzyme